MPLTPEQLSRRLDARFRFEATDGVAGALDTGQIARENAWLDCAAILALLSPDVQR